MSLQLTNLAQHAIRELRVSGVEVSINDPFVLTVQNMTQDGKPLKLTRDQAEHLATHLTAIVAAMGV